GEMRLPIRVRHFLPIGSKPPDVGQVGTAYRFSVKEAPPTKGRVKLPELDYLTHKLKQRWVPLIPSHPRDLVILAVRVVVPALGLPQLVAHGQHRHALRK